MTVIVDDRRQPIMNIAGAVQTASGLHSQKTIPDSATARKRWIRNGVVEGTMNIRIRIIDVCYGGLCLIENAGGDRADRHVAGIVVQQVGKNVDKGKYGFGQGSRCSAAGKIGRALDNGFAAGPPRICHFKLVSRLTGRLHANRI